MAARKDWTEWHLTPRGWQRGAVRSQGRNNWADDPEDRVLSYVCREEEVGESGPNPSVAETWRGKSDSEIEDLLKQYGHCPPTL